MRREERRERGKDGGERLRMRERGKDGGEGEMERERGGDGRGTEGNRDGERVSNLHSWQRTELM